MARRRCTGSAPSHRHRVGLAGALAAAVLLAGCAGRLTMAGPGSDVGRGRALLEAGQYAEAADAFRLALLRRPDDHQAQLGLGAAFEAGGEFDSALVVYDALVRERLPSRTRHQLAARLQLLARRAREAAARLTVASESTLSQEPPRPNTIAVLPFQYLGVDSTIQPLGRGVAQLLVTDLGRISAITVLEREQIQALLAEIQLGQEGRVDEATAVRSGRLLRAERIVEGSLLDVPGRAGVRVDATVVNTVTSTEAATGSASDVLDELFSLEKTILFQLIGRLGIPLTLAEEQRLVERPTLNLAAFLAFSGGLVAEDRGRFAEATAQYVEATRLDPAFSEAREAAERTAAMQEASAVPPTSVAGLLQQAGLEMSFIADNLNRVMPSGMENVDRADAPPRGRDPLGDVGGGDRVQPPSGTGSIDIKVRRP